MYLAGPIANALVFGAVLLGVPSSAGAIVDRGHFDLWPFVLVMNGTMALLNALPLKGKRRPTGGGLPPATDGYQALALLARTAADLDKHVAAYAHLEGARLVAVGKPKAAIALLEPKEKSDPLTDYLLGEAYLVDRQYARALPLLRRFTELETASSIRPAALNNIAWAAVSLHDPALLDEAERTSEEAARLLPSRAQVLVTRAAVLIARGHAAEGSALVTRALSLGPPSVAIALCVLARRGAGTGGLCRGALRARSGAERPTEPPPHRGDARSHRARGVGSNMTGSLGRGCRQKDCKEGRVRSTRGWSAKTWAGAK